MIVADSDVLIDFLRGHGPGANRVEAELRGGGLATTAVTVFELRSGVRTEKQAKQVDSLLDALHVWPLDDQAAAEAAKMRRLLDAKGNGIGMADYLIAGVCLSRGAPLLTGNVRHFERVPGLRLVAGSGGVEGGGGGGGEKAAG